MIRTGPALSPHTPPRRQNLKLRRQDAVLLLKILLAVIIASIIVYALFSITVLFLSWWLNKKIGETGSDGDFQRYPWYTAPKTFPERLAKMLVDRGFVQCFDHFALTALIFLIFGITVALFISWVMIV